MKKIWIAVVWLLAFAQAAPVGAQGTLTGDTRLACEAILCLSSGTRPSECAASLARYFGISFKSFSSTAKARLDFLNLCPAVSTDGMKALTSAIASGAGRCDAVSLNQSQIVSTGDYFGYIADTLPDYCGAYLQNGMIDLGATGPYYVGTPDNGGHWVDGAR